MSKEASNISKQAMLYALKANEKFINKVNMGLTKSVETYDDLIAANILLRKGRK